MIRLLETSAFFYVLLTLLAYEAGLLLKKHFRLPIFNPLLTAIVLILSFLLLFHTDYEDYREGTKYISR